MISNDQSECNWYQGHHGNADLYRSVAQILSACAIYSGHFMSAQASDALFVIFVISHVATFAHHTDLTKRCKNKIEYEYLIMHGITQYVSINLILLFCVVFLHRAGCNSGICSSGVFRLQFTVPNEKASRGSAHRGSYSLLHW